MANSIERMVDGEKIIFRYPFETSELVLKSFLFKTHGHEFMPIGDDKNKNLDTSDPDLIWVPFPYVTIGSEKSIYDEIIDGDIIETEDGSLKTTYGKKVAGMRICSPIDKYIDKHWKEYKVIVDLGAYTKENGFDVQRVKEALNKLHGINEPIENTPQIEAEGNMTDKEQMDSDTDIAGRNPISEELKRFLSDGKPTEDDWFFQGKYEELGQFFVIRTLSFFIKDRVEKERVLEQLQKTFSGSSEEGMKYRDRLSGRQLWMTEYHDSRNFVLETQEEDSKSENKLRFVFSLGSVKVEDVFIHSDKEGTELDMDRAMEFL